MSIQYSVDLKAPARPYPHYWEFCVGSCHAATLLRKDVQDHIRKAHNEIGFRGYAVLEAEGHDFYYHGVAVVFEEERAYLLFEL